MMYQNEKKWFAQKPVAHRGLHGSSTAPENTLAACERALEEGFAIEIDVRLTLDGIVVVFHDARLDHHTEGEGKIDAHTFAQLASLHVDQSDHKIPSLQDVLRLVDGRAPLFIELKSTFFDAKRDVNALGKVLNAYEGAYSVMSFDPRIVRWWMSGDVSGNGIAGQIFHGENIVKTYLCIVAWLLYGSPGYLMAVPLTVVRMPFFQKRRISKGRKEGRLPLLAWTVKSQDDLMRVKNISDNVIFDDSEELRPLLQK